MSATETARLMSEGLIQMGEAARLLGHKHRSTASRFANVGVKLADGTVVKLEAIRSGSRWMTSVPAVARFVQAQNPPTDGGLSQQRFDMVLDHARTRANAGDKTAQKLNKLLGLKPTS